MVEASCGGGGAQERVAVEAVFWGAGASERQSRTRADSSRATPKEARGLWGHRKEAAEGRGERSATAILANDAEYGAASKRVDGEVVQGDVGGAGGVGAEEKRRHVMHAVDPMWMRVFLGVHITAGFSSFLLAPVALATAKGGKQHKRWGMVYVWSMGVVAATALPMALYRPVLFLALVAVFSFYACFSAWRVLALKD